MDKYILNNYNNEQIGGGRINISGPVDIRYYINKKLKKKIIVIGDIHNSKDGVCNKKSNSMTITEYLNKLLDTNLNLDIFIEEIIPDLKHIYNKNRYIKYGNDFISEIINFGIKNYKKDKTKRIHFTDIRNSFLGHESFKKLEMILDLFDNVKDKNKFINLFKFYNEYCNDHIETIFTIYNELNNKTFTDKINYSELLMKVIRKSDKMIVDKILKITIDYIRQYLDILFSEYKDNEQNYELIFNIYKKGIYAEAAINDIYTILRILKNDDIKNSIIYVGKAHCDIFSKYLKILEFEPLEKYINRDDKYIRCMENVISFEDFFSN